MTTRLHTAITNRIRVATFWYVYMVNSFPLASGKRTVVRFRLLCLDGRAAESSPLGSSTAESPSAVPEIWYVYACDSVTLWSLRNSKGDDGGRGVNRFGGKAGPKQV